MKEKKNGLSEAEKKELSCLRGHRFSLWYESIGSGENGYELNQIDKRIKELERRE